MLDVLKRLEETSSRNEKLEIMKGLTEAQAKQFKRISYLAYDPSIDFWIKEYEKSDEHLDCLPLSDVLNDLEHILSARVFTGNMAKQWLESQYEMLSEDNAEILRRIILRDLRCGISAKTVNKIWPDTVYVHPYNRCSGFSEKNLKNISYPCYSQTKMDGLYCDIMVFDDTDTGKKVVEYRSRNGSFLNFSSEERDEKLMEELDGEVLMGEALALDEDGVLMDRQASNGYLNSNDIDPDRVVFYVWDLVNYDDHQKMKSSIVYEKRLTELETVISNIPFVELVSTVECHTKQDILDHFKEMREKGEEGTIIKNKNLIWKDGTSKDQIKCKVIFDCDLVPVEWKYGDADTKYKTMLGSVRFESSDGLLSVWVGSGYTDKQRVELLEVIDDYIAKGVVGAVRGNDVTINKDDPDLYSIFLPRFVEFRFDKSKADDLECVKEQVKSFTDALDQIK